MTFSLFNFIFILFHYTYPASSCQEKLIEKKWPLDCFLALELKKTPKSSPSYSNLNIWCEISKDTLIKQEPPDPLFSLYLPSDCKKIALKTKKHFNSLKILDGSFLNSFL